MRKAALREERIERKPPLSVSTREACVVLIDKRNSRCFVIAGNVYNALGCQDQVNSVFPYIDFAAFTSSAANVSEEAEIC